jgi:signal peptidase
MPRRTAAARHPSPVFDWRTKGKRMKRWKLVTLLTTGAIILLAFAFVASGLLPYRVFIVHTGSMSPTIPSTSAVIVRTHEYHVGKPISFYEQGTVITHRLVRINADGTIDTKGDANATDDPWHVPTSAIIGGVVAAPPQLGYWLMYLRNPFGLASILLSLIACWLIWSFAGGSPATNDERRERTPAKRPIAQVRHGRRASHIPRAAHQ